MGSSVPYVAEITLPHAGASQQAAWSDALDPGGPAARARVPATTGGLGAFATTAGGFESGPRNEF